MKIKENKPFVLIIYGPTGVGKTSFVDKLSESVPLEIINGDIGQFYKPLTIGTAKPDWKNHKIPHYLFDIVDTPKNITVAEYRFLLNQKVSEIWGKGKLPVIVGGSGFYLKSLFYPPIQFNNKAINNQKNIYFDSVSTKKLWNMLCKIDLERAKKIHKNDRYRIERALTIWQETGYKPSKMIPIYDPIFNYELIFLNRDRKELYERINYRTNIMINNGWIEEVQKICDTKWKSFLYRKKIIGYDVLLDYCFGDRTDESLQYSINIIQKRTRNYAKRQLTFWNSFSKKIEIDNKKYYKFNNFCKTYSVNLTLLSDYLYLKQLSSRLNLIFKSESYGVIK